METLFAFLAGAATAGATALLAPRVRGVDLSKSMAPVRKVFVGTIAAAYRAGDAVAGATAGARKEISKVVDEGRDRARAAERPVAELPAAPEPHTP